MVGAGTASIIVVLFTTFFDTIIAGNMINEEALSAVGIVASIYTFICFVGMLFGIGTAILYSRALSKFQYDKCSSIFGTGILTSIIAGFIFYFILSTFKTEILSFYGATEEVYEYASHYYSFFKYVGIIYPVYCVLYQTIYFDGDEKCTALSDIVQFFTKIILSIVLVQKVGIAGISGALFLVLVLSMLILSTHFIKQKNTIHFRFCLNFNYFKKSMGLSMIASSVYLCAALMLIISNKFIISAYGDQFLPVMNITLFVIGIYSIALSVANAVTPFLCAYIAEKNNPGVKNLMFHATMLVLAQGVCISVFIYSFSDAIPSLYGIQDSFMYDSAKKACRILATIGTLSSLSVLYSQYYLLTDKYKVGLALMYMIYLIMPAGCSIIFGVMGDINNWVRGIAIGIFLSVVIVSLVVIVRYGFRKFPLVLDKHTHHCRNFNFLLNSDNLNAACNNMRKFLEDCKASKEIIPKLVLLGETTGKCILLMNPNKKVIVEYSVYYDGNGIKFIVRDTGHIFQLSDEEQEIEGIDPYVLNAVLSLCSENVYAQSAGFNRNSFIIEEEIKEEVK